MQLRRERMRQVRQGVKWGLGVRHEAAYLIGKAKGTFIFDMWDAETGEVLTYFEKDNIITRDAGILACSLFAGDAGNTQAVAALEVFMSASVTILEAGPTAGAAYANLSVEFSGAGGLFETTFYTGGSGDAPATEVARGERLGFAPKADDSPKSMRA